MAGSAYQMIRRRIAPIAIVLAFGLLIFETCGRKERIDATIVLDLGAASETVSRVEVDVLDGAEPVASFSRDRAAAGVMGMPTFQAVLPEREVTLAIRVFVPGKLIETRRKIIADDGATVTVPLASELR